MKTAGILLITAWAVIGILSPLFGFVCDKLRKVSDSDTKFSTGRTDMRHSTLMIILFSLPLLFLGLLISALG